MAKVNCCFKGVFIFFNILFEIAGGVLLALGILGHVLYRDSEEFNTMVVGVVFLYILGGVTMVISFLGAYGAYKEKKWALIVFAVAMGLGFCGLLRVAIPMMVSRPQMKSQLEEQLRSAMPLDEANPEFLHAAEIIQTQLKCCGIFDGYVEWGSHIPNSCLCPTQHLEADKCERVESSRLEATKERSFLERLNSDSENLVYKEPCFPVLMSSIDKIFDKVVGIVFGFAFMALIGLIMSLVLIWCINGHRTAVPMIFSVNPAPPAYSKLYRMS
ncbi:tetraspanin-8-like [Anguilla anguilla]|nr:tetraspanin-8-like [Anguilla anguilla]